MQAGSLWVLKTGKMGESNSSNSKTWSWCCDCLFTEVLAFLSTSGRTASPQVRLGSQPSSSITLSLSLPCSMASKLWRLPELKHLCNHFWPYPQPNSKGKPSQTQLLATTEDSVPSALLGSWERGGRKTPSVSGTGIWLANKREMIPLTEILLRKKNLYLKQNYGEGDKP